MTPLQRASLLFNVTTQPLDTGIASPHSGSFSEIHWRAPSANLPAVLTALAPFRARLLPRLANIIGFRIENFNLDGNKLYPTGASAGKFNFPGTGGLLLNLPQDALQLNMVADGAPNTSRFAVKCMPDDQIKQGEFQPSGQFLSYVTQFMTALRDAGFGFVGRVKTNPTYRVNAIANTGVVTLPSVPAVVDGSTYVRFIRVYNDQGLPVKGTFLVTDHTSTTLTLQGLSTTLTSPSGVLRVDQSQFFPYGIGSVGRACIRKIGRPFEVYRGRRSKTRAA